MTNSQPSPIRPRVSRNHTHPLVKLVSEGNLSSVQLFLDDIDEQDLDNALLCGGGRTPAHVAAANGSLEILECLLDVFPRCVDALDKNGFTPLHEAAFHGHLQIIDALVNNGANVDAKSLVGWTPLHRAAWNGRTLAALLLIGLGANPDAKDSAGETALHEAAYYGHTETAVKLITRGGANPNAKAGSVGKTPLHFAIKNRHVATALSLMDCPGVNVNAKSAYLETPLHEAARYDVQEVVPDLILKHGAMFNAKDMDGDTAMMVANKRENFKFAKALTSTIHEHVDPEHITRHRQDSNDDVVWSGSSRRRLSSRMARRTSSSFSRMISSANPLKGCMKHSATNVHDDDNNNSDDNELNLGSYDSSEYMSMVPSPAPSAA